MPLLPQEDHLGRTTRLPSNEPEDSMKAEHAIAGYFPPNSDDEDCRLSVVEQMLKFFPDAMLIDNGGPHVVDDGEFKKVIIAFTSAEYDRKLAALTQERDTTYDSFIAAVHRMIRRFTQGPKE